MLHLLKFFQRNRQSCYSVKSIEVVNCGLRSVQITEIFFWIVINIYIYHCHSPPPPEMLNMSMGILYMKKVIINSIYKVSELHY